MVPNLIEPENGEPKYKCVAFLCYRLCGTDFDGPPFAVAQTGAFKTATSPDFVNILIFDRDKAVLVAPS